MSIHPHVFQEYDFDIQKIENFRSTIKLTTQLGDYAMKRLKKNPEQLEQMMEIMGYLERHQLLVNPIIPNKFGDFAVPTSDGFVYVSKWLEMTHLKLNYQPHFLSAIKIMAKMHKRGLDFDSPVVFQLPSMNEIVLMNKWKQRVVWLKKYQKQLRRNQGLSTFEHVLSTYIPFLKDWADEAIDQLEQWIIEHQSIQEQRRTICHGNYHHRNIVIVQGKLVLLDFENVSFDTPVRDIAQFIRQYILNKEHRVWAMEWLDVYQKITPLNPAERQLLAILLLFPERMFSLIKGYEKKEKNWSEETYLKKLQVRWSQMRELIWFIDQYLK